jgi:5S rRNA maturation endonuclease (ribonuclease M5)
LAKDNQIIFSTHSPFMVEADKLDRVRAVYVDKKGKTAVTADLRAAAPGSVQSKSIYAAHAALGLTVSDVILQGCQPVIVEGQSDQFYFTMLKNFLISRGDLLPVNDLVFMSGGGTKAIRAVASILSCKDNQLPYVIVDSDRNGEELVKTLGNQMYMGQRNRIIALGKFRDVTGTEVEDLLPTKLIAEAFSRDYRGREIEFSDAVDANQAIVPQMEKFAKDNELTLKDGWKVELARAVLRKASANPPLLESDAKLVEIWKRIFSVIVGDPASVEVATGQTDAVQTVMQ